MINFSKISQELLKGLPKRQKEVIVRRFGLKTGDKETLEKIGKDFGITRERVRQIEADGINKVKPGIKNYQDAISSFEGHLKQFGGVRREDLLLEELGGPKNQAFVGFLMTLSDQFKRCKEDDIFFALWTLDDKSLSLCKKGIENLFKKLKAVGKPISIEDKQTLYYLTVSKRIQKNEEELYGLKEWPEINPRGVKDKAYLVLRKEKKPLHFSDIARKIEGSVLQTVHNELIKDARFVLVARGMYALGEWGFYPGQVKDVIARVLTDSKKPLTKEEVLNKVLEQRMVKSNTVLLNLNNKDYFLKDSQGKYNVKEA